MKSFNETGENHLFFKEWLASVDSSSKRSNIAKKRGNCLGLFVWQLSVLL